MKPAVLFVCLGNICRSPLAEAAFRREAAELGLDVEIDSAGTGDWNIGRAPDPRAQDVAVKNGVDISSYRARQVTPDDFKKFTHILALDAQNMIDLKAIAPDDEAKTRLSLMLDHLPGHEGQAVMDPYYGEAEGFNETWQLVSDAARALAQRIARENSVN